MSERTWSWLVGDLSWKRLLASGSFLYVSLAAFAWFGSERLIFLPQPTSYEDGPGILKLDAGGTPVSAVHLPREGARYHLLVSHGNAEDLGDMRPVLTQLGELGFAVLAYDYPGYGTSPGTPSEAGAYAAAEAAYAYMTKTLGVPPSRLIGYGRSVGSGPAVDLASRRPHAGLILENPFTSAFRVRTLVPLLPFDRFDNMAKIGRVGVPLLVMHGREDAVIPFWHGQALHQAAPEPRLGWWVDRAGHNEVGDWDPEGYARAIGELVKLVEAP